MNSRCFSVALASWLSVLASAAGEANKAAVVGAGAAPLPVLVLSTTNTIVSERKVSCTVRMISPQAANESSSNASAVVRIHGGVSQAYAKKSYGLTLSNSVSWLGMRDSAHWVVNAAFVDRSLMRHKLAYDLFRSLSTPRAPRYSASSRFVEVHLGTNYNGAYLLMERVDRALLGLRKFDSNAPSHASIYKAVDHAANFSQPGHGGYEQREPDAETRAYWGPLDDLNKFVSRAPDADFFNPTNGISTRLDIENAIDFHLLVLLTCNSDGITKNFIIAREAVTTNAPLPRFFFVPWDYDGTFGRNWDASRVGPDLWLSNHLFDRLHGNDEFRKKFAARWKAISQREFSPATIHRMIDDNARALGLAMQRNYDHWRMLDGPFPDRVSFEEELVLMKEWVAARVKWLDAEIERRAR